MPNAPIVEAIEEPAELLYLGRRKRARRRQLAVILASSTLVLVYLGWKVGSHLAAASWLEANQYVVVWGIDQSNWKQGGATTVRYSARPDFFKSTRPFADLKFLGNLHHLEELDLSTMTGLGDADAASLDELTDLLHLNLDRSRLPEWTKVGSAALTDATLSRIARLSRLRELNLGGQRITDAGLKNLAGLEKLQTLDLVDTPITDSGLELLKSLRSLRTLDLMSTNVTAQGVSNFEAAMPRVKVVADPPPSTPPSTPRSTTDRQP